MSGDAGYYQKLYAESPEPWNYRGRGGEILRHLLIADLVRKIKPDFGKVLDIGCSQGQLTEKFLPISKEIVAFDVAEAAVRKASAYLGKVHFLVARLPGLPFPREHFDLAVSADCISEFVPDDMKDQVLEEIAGAVKEGGYAVFSDYMRPKRFAQFEARVRDHFRIVDVVYLNDRLWYQFESWFKKVRHQGWAKKIISSVTIARILRAASSLFGKYGSCHVVILAKKAAHG